MDPTRRLLRLRVEERDYLLKRVTETLLSDERVVAAWLFGSIGRGDSDELSDIDVFAVVKDEVIEDFVRNRRNCATLGVEPALFVEAMQNRPPGGAYLMGLYSGVTGFHEVDWYWSPLSQTKIPTDALVLFDRAGLTSSGVSTRFEYQSTETMSFEEELLNLENSFWAMLLIAAKKAARNPMESDFRPLRHTFHILTELESALGINDEQTLADHSKPESKMQSLKDMAHRMRELSPILLKRASLAKVPNWNGVSVFEMAMRFLDLVEPMILAKGNL